MNANRQWWVLYLMALLLLPSQAMLLFGRGAALCMFCGLVVGVFAGVTKDDPPPPYEGSGIDR